MKVLVYSCREDEKELFEEYENSGEFEFTYCSSQPTMKNYFLAEGIPIITIVGTQVPDELLKKFADLGVKLISCRCIGLDHINLAYAEELGIKVTNISYSPNAVADYAIMLMLMCLRKEKYILDHYKVRDYTLAQNQGRELRDMTVGVVGGGRIGRTVIREIRGFGCRILVYDKYENEEVKKYAEYVPYETLLRQSDVITFHAPGNDDTYHMLNLENVKLLKKGAVVINTSRGSNIDNKALIYGIEHGIISQAGLDVVDHEPQIYNINHRDSIPSDHDVAVLESYPNVIITPHTAFYTDHAVRDMIAHALDNIRGFVQERKGGCG